jgi:hypothetical protein
VRREKRWMVTGNILAGFARYPGQIITYTKDDGTLEQGVLMRRGFDYAKAKESEPAVFPDAEKILAFFDAAGAGATVGTRDGVLVVRRSRGGLDEYDVETPASRRQGGQFFLDRKLTQALGGDFAKAGSVMRARVDRAAVRRALQYLRNEAGVSLQAMTHGKVARQVLGLDGGAQGENNLRVEQPRARYGAPGVAQAAPYEEDLFGNPVPDSAGKGGNPRSNRARVPRVVDAPTAIPLRTIDDALPGSYAITTAVVEERREALPVTRITTEEEAAQAFAYLNRNAVERMDALITDRNGNPLAVVGGFKGTLAEASWFPDTMLKEAFRIRGAANLWLGHNHPSGTARLSDADVNSGKVLHSMLRGSGISMRGILAVVPTDGGVRFGFTGYNETTSQPSDASLRSNASVRMGANVVTVPVVNRVFTRNEKLRPAPLSSTTDAKNLVPALSQGRPGMLLMDVQYTPTAFVALDPAGLEQLRGKGGRMDALFRTLSMANAGAAMVANPNAVVSDMAIANLGAFLRANNVRLLDAISFRWDARPGAGSPASEVRSHSEQGKTIVGDVFLSRERRTPSQANAQTSPAPAGLSVSDVRAALAPVLRRAKNLPARGVRVVRSVSDLPGDLQNRVMDMGAQEQVEGVYDEASGAVWIVADHVPTALRAEQVLFHELFGHFGLRGLLGADMDAALRDLAARNANVRKRVAQLRADYGYNEAQANEEAVVEFAERGMRLEGLRRLGAAIQQGLRRLGMERMANWMESLTNAEVMTVLAEARRFVREGEMAAGWDGAEVLLSARGRTPEMMDALARLRAAERSFAATERAYGGRSAYARAKAADRTKLTYGQWVQVRMPEFKAWFGNWEALRAQQRLDAMEPVRVRVPEQWRTLSKKDLRAQAKQAIEELARSGTPLVNDEIGEVTVTRGTGVGKFVSTSADPAKLMLAADLRAAFKPAIFASAAAPEGAEPNVAAYEKLLVPLRIEDDNLVAIFTVRRMADGRQLYNAVTLEDGQRKTPAVSPRDTPIAGERATSANTGVNSFVRRDLERVNPATVSKVVDPDTGEPMIMYHGTENGGFTVFDRLKSTEWRQPSMDTVGSWFSNNPSESDGAGLYGRFVMPVYLSIQNPKKYRTFSAFLRHMHRAAGRPMPEAAGRGSTEELRAELKEEGYDGIEFEQTANESLMQDIRDMQDAVQRAKQEEFSVPRRDRLPYTQKRERLEQTLNSMRKEIDEFGSSTEFDGQRVFIAFEPEQIKSAIGNVGTWDRRQPDIMLSRGLKVDVPNEQWLQEQIDYAKQRGRDRWGVPYMGKITAGYRGATVNVPTSVLAALPGQRNEQRNVREESLEYIRENWDEVSKEPPYIEVAYNGEAWVSEGNHRIMVAAERGESTMPVEIRYFDGGERVDGPLKPGLYDRGYQQAAPGRQADIMLSRGRAPNAQPPTPQEQADEILSKRRARFTPLETLTRMAVRATFVDRLTGAAYDRLLRMLNQITPERVKAGLVSDYGLPEAVVDRRIAMQGTVKTGIRQVGEIVAALGNLTRAESRVAYQWMNADDPQSSDYFLEQLPAESVRVLADVEKWIDKMSDEAVKLGLLSPESRERHRYAYLRRSYLKHEEDATPQQRTNRRRAIAVLGDQYKGRGIVDGVEMNRIEAAAPTWWQRKLEGQKADKALKGQEFLRLERLSGRAQATAPLEGMEPGQQRRRVLEVVYWPAAEPVPAKYAGWDYAGRWEVRDVRGSQAIMWRDFTAQERERMGEIDEVKYAVARTLHGMLRDIETARYLKWVADTYSRPTDAGLNVVEASETLRSSFRADEWVRVPDTVIPKTGGLRRYGALAGRYVPGPIWNDIRQSAGPTSLPLGEIYNEVLRAWKISKTALSPAVHTNNIMANFVMADWHDVRAAHMAKALEILVRSQTPAHKNILNRFEDAGGGIGTWSLSELQREQLEPLLAQLKRDVAQNSEGLVGAAAALQLALSGRWREAISAASMSKGAVVTQRLAKAMIDLYQAEDVVFRLAAFIKAKEEGADDLAAAKLARKSFLDYQINAPWIQMMRQTAFPFIAFTYRAAPMLLETAAKRPWKLAKIGLVLGGLNALGYALSGGDEDKERKLLPEEKAGKIFGVVAPKLIRMPWNDENDSPVFLDVRRWIPVGDIFDLEQTHAAVPIMPLAVPGGPLAVFAELVFNRSQFTGKPITKDTDTGVLKAIAEMDLDRVGVEQEAKVLDHLYKTFAPNIGVVPGTYAFEAITKAAGGRTDAFGREQSAGMAAVSALGVKVGAYPRDVLLLNETRKRDAQVREIRENLTALKRELARKGISSEEFAEKQDRQMEKLRRINERFAEKVAP